MIVCLTIHSLTTITVLASVPTYEPPLRGPQTVLDRLLRLDSFARPGLSHFEFKRLFANCNCGLVMTCRVFRNHICAAGVQNQSTIIDLTSDDSDESSDEEASQPPADGGF